MKKLIILFLFVIFSNCTENECVVQTIDPITGDVDIEFVPCNNGEGLMI